jgi:hypothetical protein
MTDRSIAILCPGPSLADFLARPREHEAFIGVNRAAAAWPCDYWAFNDHEAFDWWHHSVQRSGRKPRCFTSNQAFSLIANRLAVDSFEWLHYASIDTDCPSDPGWTNYTLTVAMVLAEYLVRRKQDLFEPPGLPVKTGTPDFTLSPVPGGIPARAENHDRSTAQGFVGPAAQKASRTWLVIYGCDWSGTQDWDGADPPRDAAACRSEYRWKNEQHKFWHVMRWLNSRGIDVVRVGSAEPKHAGSL